MSVTPHRYPRTTPEEMAAEVLANPDVERELFADVFIGSFCVTCGGGGALFATPVWFSPCPTCLAKRMRRLLELRDDLPWWVAYLAEQCENEVRCQAEAERRALSVVFDDFQKCHRCGRFILQRDARFVADHKGEFGLCRAHCQDCFSEARG